MEQIMATISTWILLLLRTLEMQTQDLIQRLGLSTSAILNVQFLRFAEIPSGSGYAGGDVQTAYLNSSGEFSVGYELFDQSKQDKISLFSRQYVNGTQAIAIRLGFLQFSTARNLTSTPSGSTLAPVYVSYSAGSVKFL